MMKKLFAIVMVLIGSITGSFAQSMLKISLADHSRFNIVLNGRHFNKQGQSITVGDLPPGRQRLKIFTLSRGRWGGAYEDLVYQGKIDTYNGMITRFVYDPNTDMADIHETEISPNDPHYHPSMPQADINNDDVAQQAPAQADMPVASPVTESNTGTLTQDKLKKLKTKTDAKNNDTEKMKVLKNSLRNELMTTYEVGQMMDWFIFESSKVDFATWAYNSTVDHRLYYSLDGKLKTSEAKEDLANFIKEKQ